MAAYMELYRPPLSSLKAATRSKDLIEEEQEEIISYMPDYGGKRILELGAGNGSFTKRLAGLAGHVTAYDFVKDYVDRNRSSNGMLRNVSFKYAEVKEIEFPEASFDIIFSNWFFTCLSDDDMEGVLGRILRWVTPGGFLVLRESCNSISDMNRTTIKYYKTIHGIQSSSKGSFEILRGKSILTYVKDSGDPNQLCFVARHIKTQESGGTTKQAVNNLYSLNNIFMSERMYGYMWFSPGGESTNRELCKSLQLRPGQRVLDVGCGTGANTFFMARHYGACVHGIDISASMIHLAIERQGKLEIAVRKRVQLEINDVLQVDLDPETLDLVYSRDVFLHVRDKRRLFQKFWEWLKPGGVLFFTDFCRGPGQDTEEFLCHITQKGYSLSSEGTYSDLLLKEGFTDILSQDRRPHFLKVLRRERESFVSGRESFVRDFSECDYEKYTKSWGDKIQFAEMGQLAWTSFMAKK